MFCRVLNTPLSPILFLVRFIKKLLPVLTFQFVIADSNFYLIILICLTRNSICIFLNLSTATLCKICENMDFRWHVFWYQENCPPEICPPENYPPENCSPENCPLWKYPLWKLPLWKLPPRNLPPRKLPPRENFPLGKSPPNEILSPLINHTDERKNKITKFFALKKAVQYNILTYWA